MLRIAINGYGRIGRCITRSLFEREELRDKVQLVAINDLADNALLAHLTQFDSNHGHFKGEVAFAGDELVLNGQTVKMLSEPDPLKLPWSVMEVDLVMECTGRCKTLLDAEKHIQAGAGKVLISAPMAEAEKTVVYGVNHQLLTGEDLIVSNASCTTNCLAPVVKVLHEHWGLESGLMTTIHAYTNDQHLVDQAPGDVYRSRSAAMSMIPTTTGAAAAVGKVLPELAGRLHGMAVRVPTANVSLVDLSCVLSRPAGVDEVNAAMQQAAASELQGVLAFNEKPLVSVDFNHARYSSIFDANHTMVAGNQLKIMSWYDNEWGFSNRMLDVALLMG